MVTFSHQNAFVAIKCADIIHSPHWARTAQYSTRAHSLCTYIYKIILAHETRRSLHLRQWVCTFFLLLVVQVCRLETQRSQARGCVQRAVDLKLRETYEPRKSDGGLPRRRGPPHCCQEKKGPCAFARPFFIHTYLHQQWQDRLEDKTWT